MIIRQIYLHIFKHIYTIQGFRLNIHYFILFSMLLAHDTIFKASIVKLFYFYFYYFIPKRIGGLKHKLYRYK